MAPSRIPARMKGMPKRLVKTKGPWMIPMPQYAASLSGFRKMNRAQIVAMIAPLLKFCPRRKEVRLCPRYW